MSGDTCSLGLWEIIGSDQLVKNWIVSVLVLDTDQDDMLGLVLLAAASK